MSGPKDLKLSVPSEEDMSLAAEKGLTPEKEAEDLGPGTTGFEKLPDTLKYPVGICSPCKQGGACI
ncbi:MAG: hypothetical protein LBT40_07030 [Deltaproteobacteria bacterium]|jgi:hypothetical protein|nr:hypothetical protein [Deltaproteobacteria bacterium]